ENKPALPRSPPNGGIGGDGGGTLYHTERPRVLASTPPNKPSIGSWLRNRPSTGDKFSRRQGSEDALAHTATC
ncbi:hypothetical protein FRC08_007632, partial [Ceratobasidium sp. 394]